MVPHHSPNVRLKKERSNGGRAGVKREFSSTAKVENPFLWSDGWRLGMEQRPAAVKDGLTKIAREVDRGEIRRTQS